MMDDAPRLKLVELVSRHGRGLAGEPRRCEALLRDYCGEHRREISALTSAAEEHAAAELLTPQRGTPRAALLGRLARRLCDHVAITEEAATWAVNSWALALGVVSDDELKTLESPTVARAEADAATATPAPDAAPRVATNTPHVVTAASSALTPIVVAADGSGDYVSIGEALENAAAGARLLVRPGVYEEGVIIDEHVEIVGDGPVEKIVIRSAAASCLRMRGAQARVAGLTLQGVAGSGEGVFAVDIEQGRLLLEDCRITSETLSCVAVHGRSTEPLIRRCRISDGADSGLYFFDGARGSVEDCEIHGHSNVGVAITAGADPAVRRSKIYGGANAGVASWGEGRGVLEECEIYGNRLAGVGVSEGARLSARACRIYEGDNSGVFVHGGGDATLEACDIHGHRAAEVAVKTLGQLTALRCQIHEGRGAGVFIREGGQALIQECGVTLNAGAGVSIGDGSLAAVLGCQVKDNGEAGIRVAAGGAARVNESDLSGNRSGAWDVEEGAFVEGGDNAEE
ncbi:MAG TPA: pectinesterase family protein [Pyrinomonadaceae bacterium]